MGRSPPGFPSNGYGPRLGKVRHGGPGNHRDARRGVVSHLQPSVQVEGDHLAVIVEGQGESRAAAMDQAWLEAVRLAVGMMIEARTEIDQNQVAERIIAHSRGVVDGYEILMTDNQAGVYRLRMKAKVRRDVLHDGLQYVASKGQVIAFSADDLKPRKDLALESLESQDAQGNTEATRARDGAALLVEVLRKFKPEDFFILQATSKLRALPDKPDTFEMDFEVSLNEDRYYKEYVPEMKRVLDQVAVEKKKEFYRDPKAIEAIRALKKEGIQHTGSSDSVYIQYAQQAKGAMLFDTSNPFAYLVYTLEPALLEQLSQIYGEKAKSTAYKFTIGFYDESNNEVFSADSTIDLAINGRDINGIDLNFSLEAKAKKSISTRTNTSIGQAPWKDFLQDTLFKITNRTVTTGTASWLEIIHVQEGKSYWVRQDKVKEVFGTHEDIGKIINYYLPSINMAKPHRGA